MPSRSLTAFAIALIAAGVYLLAALLPPDQNMSAPLRLQQIVLPRLSSFASQVASARSFVPVLQKPLSSSTPLTTSQAPFQSQEHQFGTTAKMTHDTISLKEAIANRRSIYSLTKKSTIPDDKIKAIVTHAIENVPSSFNSQSTRLVVLVKEDHDKFWNIVTEILKAHVPEDKWEHTAQRMAMFQGAYGTILFYEDQKPVQEMQNKFPNYADKFPQWSEHTNAMHQYALWTALTAEGLGCNLQHYNPLPDQKVSEIWKVPLTWQLKSQLVFGTPTEDAIENLKEKTQKPSEERVFFHGM